MKKIIVTTSWDDGNELDVKLADLLRKYHLKGTFYISKQGKFRSLNDDGVKMLAQDQEIGAHGITHPILTSLSLKDPKEEILGSKKYLEHLLVREIKMFCYPGGWFNEEIKNLVKEARFLGARTVKDKVISFPKDRFEFGTTLHVYPLSFWQKLRFFRWSRRAKNMFERALKKGDVYHIWGHSWEIEKHGLWLELEETLKYIANRNDCLYLTNGETLEKLR